MSRQGSALKYEEWFSLKMKEVILEMNVCEGVGWILTTLTYKCWARFREVRSGWRLKACLNRVCVFLVVEWMCVQIEWSVFRKGEPLGLLFIVIIIFLLVFANKYPFLIVFKLKYFLHQNYKKILLQILNYTYKTYNIFFQYQLFYSSIP